MWFGVEGSNEVGRKLSNVSSVIAKKIDDCEQLFYS
jgi:hypothetical protein